MSLEGVDELDAVLVELEHGDAAGLVAHEDVAGGLVVGEAGAPRGTVVPAETPAGLGAVELKVSTGGKKI